MNNDSFDEANIVDTLEETDKKCSLCGGTMDFDPSSGKLLCPYCGNTEIIDETPEKADELSYFDAENTENCNWGVEKKTVVCKNCGAETVYDALETAGECPYCGSNQVMEASEVHTIAPSGVCPFKIDENEASSKFLRWLKKKLFCPSELKKKVNKESLKGVYLPYWTFDSMTDSSYSARYGIKHIITVGSGKNRRTKVVVHWHRTSGNYDEFFNDTLVLGTTRHDQGLLSKIEPFNTEDNVSYKPEYLSGFAAERYSVGIKSAWDKAKSFIQRKLTHSIEREIRSRHHADLVNNLSFTTGYSEITYKYMLLPVWFSSFVYRGKKYSFMINGQTGKVGGRYPISPFRVAIAVLCGFAAFGLLVLLYLLFTGGIGMVSESVDVYCNLPMLK